MNECPHDLAEKETACADGWCPICLKAASDELTPKMEEVLEHVKGFAVVIEGLKQDTLELTKQLAAHTQQLEMAVVALSGEYDEDDARHAVYVSLDKYLNNYSKQTRERLAKRREEAQKCSPTTS